MTREEKVVKKQKRSFLRKKKRIEKDLQYINLIPIDSSYKTISWGRKKFQGRIFECEMGYSACEERGYCNGDC